MLLVKCYSWFRCHCTKNHIFFFEMFWKDRLSKKISLEYDLSCIISIFFPENMILFFKRKAKNDLSQKILGNIMFYVDSVKMVFLFPTVYGITLLSKKQRRSSPDKYTYRWDFKYHKKKIFILENMIFLLIEHLKMTTKFTF